MNAIILAAGKSNRFAPFTYEKPKGIFRVRGEILIDRQIEQLKDAGIDEIIVVIGFMKEKFFYLEEKYGVKFVINNTFAIHLHLREIYIHFMRQENISAIHMSAARIITFLRIPLLRGRSVLTAPVCGKRASSVNLVFRSRTRMLLQRCQ